MSASDIQRLDLWPLVVYSSIIIGLALLIMLSIQISPERSEGGLITMLVVIGLVGAVWLYFSTGGRI